MEFPKIVLDKISYYLRERDETVSVAEGVTSGFLQLAFSQMQDASEFYKGGITIYNPTQLMKHLNINSDHENFISRQISEAMAINAASFFNTEWSIATTGFAVPSIESKDEIFAYYCIAYRGTIIRSDRIELHPMTKAFDAQHYFMEYILGCLRCEVKRNHTLINI